MAVAIGQPCVWILSPSVPGTWPQADCVKCTCDDFTDLVKKKHQIAVTSSYSLHVYTVF